MVTPHRQNSIELYSYKNSRSTLPDGGGWGNTGRRVLPSERAKQPNRGEGNIGTMVGEKELLISRG